MHDVHIDHSQEPTRALPTDGAHGVVSRWALSEIPVRDSHARAGDIACVRFSWGYETGVIHASRRGWYLEVTSDLAGR
jgi:hypothetical protein